MVGEEYDYVTRTSQNQGILQTTGFVNKENINPSGTWSLGLLQMDFFFRKKPWYAGQFVRKIVPLIDIPINAVIFFTTILNLQKKVLLSVLVRDVDQTFRNIVVSLPITDTGEIDFEFMVSFIRNLEEERIRELSTYLTASGLDNCELSREETSALTKFSQINWRIFKLGDLFDVFSYKKRFDANKIRLLESGGHPYIVRMGGNNGQKGFINEDPKYLNPGNTISFGQDTATIFYQEKPYFTGDKIKVLVPKDKRFHKSNAPFFLAAMHRTFGCFSWGASRFDIETLKSQPINLPVAVDGSPDYAMMDTLIRAVQKLVVRNLSEYTNNGSQKQNKQGK